MSMKHPIQVECYEGYRGAEKPKQFTYNGEEYLIQKVIQRSVVETYRDRYRVYRYLVRCFDGYEYLLIFDLQLREWFLES